MARAGRPDLHRPQRGTDTANTLLRRVAASGQGIRRAEGHHLSRPAPLLRLTADPPRREREGGAAPSGTRHGGETLDTYTHLWPDSEVEPDKPSTMSSWLARTICAPKNMINCQRRRSEARWRTSRPVSRVLSCAEAHGRPSISGCRYRQPPAVYPGARAGRPSCRGSRSLSDLAPGGVCRAARVTPGAGGLLHRRFTLTAVGRSRRRRSVLCGTVPRVTPGGCYPPPCPVEPGLSSADVSAETPDATVRPARPPCPTA